MNPIFASSNSEVGRISPRRRQRFGFLPACVILIISYALPALAQSADKILKQSIKVMTSGEGEKVLRRVTAWRATGSGTRPRGGATRRLQIAAKPPHPHALK